MLWTAQRSVAGDNPTRSANVDSTAENGESTAGAGDSEEPATILEANETQTQISDTKASVHSGDLRRMMSTKGSRKANMVAWSVHSATSARPTSSDTWGAETGSASSQFPFSISDDLDQFGLTSTTAPTDELDLLGSPTTTVPVPTSTGNHNPFTPQYNPFADIWAKDNESHFC